MKNLNGRMVPDAEFEAARQRSIADMSADLLAKASARIALSNIHRELESVRLGTERRERVEQLFAIVESFIQEYQR
jgi:hypothetical protein